MSFISSLKSLVYILLAAFSLTSCSEDFHLVKPFTLDLDPPPGPPIYQQGWKDGCESALSGYGWNIYKASYTLKRDGWASQDPVYLQIWRDAYGYCRAYIKVVRLHGYGNHNNAFGLDALFAPREHN